jgi:hypothetical protein
VSERLQSFLELSALLTGFGRVALLGTGVADTYHSTLEAVLPPVPRPPGRRAGPTFEWIPPENALVGQQQTAERRSA